MKKIIGSIINIIIDIISVPVIIYMPVLEILLAVFYGGKLDKFIQLHKTMFHTSYVLCIFLVPILLFRIAFRYKDEINKIFNAGPFIRN